MALDWYTYKNLGSKHLERCFRKFLKEEWRLINVKIKEEDLLHPYTDDGIRITSVGPDSIFLENGEEVSVDDMYDSEAWQIIRMVYKPEEFQAAIGISSVVTKDEELMRLLGVNKNNIRHLKKLFKGL